MDIRLRLHGIKARRYFQRAEIAPANLLRSCCTWENCYERLKCNFTNQPNVYVTVILITWRRNYHGELISMERWWIYHNNVIKWKHSAYYRPFVRGIHRSPVNSSHKGQWRGALVFFICAWINSWVNNGEAGDLRRHRAHYEVIIMWMGLFCFPEVSYNYVVYVRLKHG